MGFDVIGDLHLGPDDSFNWEGKATSLYCIVAGNVSSDLRTIFQTLKHLCQIYQGVFYVPGVLEYKNFDDKYLRTKELLGTMGILKNLAILYHNVVIIDGVAILGANGWEGEVADINEMLQLDKDCNRYDDISYLNKSILKLQKHLDVKKIIIVTNAVPNPDLYFGEKPEYIDEQINLDYCIKSDTETKITYWIYGNYSKPVDTKIGSINYINNPYYHQRPYWAKRIAINL